MPANLKLTSVIVTPPEPKAGQRVTFAAEVENTGDAASPDGTVIGVGFQVDGSVQAWGDYRTAGMAPGEVTIIAASSGPNGKPYWIATEGSHAVLAWVDDVNRIPEGNETDNKATETLVVAPGAVVPPDPGNGGEPPPANSTICNDLNSFQTALNRGDLDVTLTVPVNAPNGGINIPRKNEGRIVRCTGNGIINRGAGGGHVLRSDGGGGRLTLIGVRVDGGWRSNKHEGSDADSNYMLGGFDFLRIENCVTCYSYRTGWNVGDCKVLEIVNSTMFACPRDTCWEPAVRDYLFEGNLVQHCGDDGWGTHQGGIGNNLVTKSIICRNNTFRDAFGFKGHAGAADGTHNGKPSRILVENNTFEAAGLYCTYFFKDMGNNEPWANPRNITFKNNTFRDMRLTTQSSGGQRIGVGILLGFPEGTYDNTLRFEANTYIRNAGNNGKRLQDCYEWGKKNGATKPTNVPGAAEFEGFFAKNGFKPDEKFELADRAYRNDGGQNPGAIAFVNNTWQGGWNNIP